MAIAREDALRDSVYFNRVVVAIASSMVLALGGCDSGKPPVSASNGISAPAEPSPSANPTGATGATGPTGATTAPAAAVDPTSTPQPSSNGALRWTGTFRSPSCGARTYERILTLKEDRTFTATDRVSPCPPKVQCIWSGIVVWSGTWVTDEKGVVLTKTSGGKGPTGAANTDVPIRLELDKATMLPAEIDGGNRCVYARDTGGAETR